MKPIIDKNTEILILGSYPWKESLKRGEYYTNPKNVFWKIFNIDKKKVPYKERIKFLLKNKIGLWDSCLTANRKTSLDKDIEDCVANNFKFIFKNHNIKKILFNWKKAKEEFNNLVKEQNIKLNPKLKLILVSSTSNSNTWKTEKEKKKEWLKALKK